MIINMAMQALPEIILAVVGILVLLIGQFARADNISKIVRTISLFGLFASLVVIANMAADPGGAFVVDDFGRQRISPQDLLNRWILPLEKRIDFLTLSNGIKFQVPFDVLLIFCTNIDPKELLDEAFLRRIPYKVKLEDPSEEKFRNIMKFVAPQYNIEYDNIMVSHLINHYFRGKRPFRSCHPRDILEQIVNASVFLRKRPKLTKSLINIAAFNYFAAMEHNNKRG